MADYVMFQGIKVPVGPSFSKLDRKQQFNMLSAYYVNYIRKQNGTSYNPESEDKKSAEVAANPTFQQAANEALSDAEKQRKIDEQVAAMEADWKGPKGEGYHGMDGYDHFPDSGVVVRNDSPQYLADPMMAYGVAKQRGLDKINGSDPVPDWLVSPVAPAFAVANDLMGNRVGAERARQSYDQAMYDSLLPSIGAQIVGGGAATGAAKLITGKVAPAALAYGTELMTSGGGAARAAKGAVAGAGLASASEAYNARPGERLENATDPITLALGGGIGALAGKFTRPVTRLAPDPNTLALPHPDTPTPNSVDFRLDGAPFKDELDLQQQNDEIQAYLASLAADTPKVVPNPASEAASVVQAAERVGIKLPKAVVTADPRFGRGQPSVVSGAPTRRAQAKLNTQLADAAASETSKIGAAQPDVGAASAGLERSASAGSEQNLTTAQKAYDQFVHGDMNADTNVYIDPMLQEQMKSLLARRKRAGSPTSTDDRMIEEAFELVIKRGKGSFSGLVDARDRIAHRIRNYKDAEGRSPIKEGAEDALKILDTAIEDAVLANNRGGFSYGEEALDYYKKVRGELDAARNERSAVEKATRNGAVFSRLTSALRSSDKTSMAELAAIKKSAGSDFNDAVSFAISDMGRLGETPFDASTFAANWSKVTPDAKKVSLHPSHVQALDDIAEVSKRLEKVKGTGKAVYNDPRKNIGTSMAIAGFMPGISSGIITSMGLVGETTRLIKNLNLSRAKDAAGYAKLLKTIEEEQANPGPKTKAKIKAALEAMASVAGGAGAGAATGTVLSEAIADPTDSNP